MFWKKERQARSIKNAVNEFSGIHANQGGCTRRATSMVPVAMAGTHEIEYTSTVRFHELLVSLEGHERTGCLRIISPKRKSRSAIMIYKGRVVGCVYGSKKLGGQLLQEDALKHILADLANPGNLLDAYQLPEPLVLAAAALFEGQTVQIDKQQKAADMMDQALRSIADSKLPGCAILSTDRDEMVLAVYLLDGKIISLFSAKDGWIKPSYEVALSCARQGACLQVKAACLPASARQENGELGFSLTGLSDLRREIPANQLKGIASFTTMPGEGRIYSQLEPALGAARQPSRAHRGEALDPNAISRQPSHNVFSIAP